jgi:putative transposase
MGRIWSIYCDSARIVSWGFCAQIHALVLMNNHYHLLISTPSSNLDTIMMHFQREISRHVTRLAKEQRFRFQSRYKWKLIKSPTHYLRTYQYIAHNPVEAGLCSSPLAYPYSTIGFELGSENVKECCPIYTRSNLSQWIPENPASRAFLLEPQGSAPQKPEKK